MNKINFLLTSVNSFARSKWLIAWCYSFLYWMIFLLVLEPGNLYRALQFSQTLSFLHEAIRIFVAALLGTSCTPVIHLINQRVPLLAPFNWRHIALYVASIMGLALGLVITSCFFAVWLFEHQWFPTLLEIRTELIGNYLLVTFAIFGYVAIIQLTEVMRRTTIPQKTSTTNSLLTRVEVKSRGKLMFVEVSDIDWIETQGNYLALHVGPEVHLIRETLVKFTAQLEVNRFVQVHRRIIVAINRIKNIQPLTNGDSTLLLTTGCELRASRRYREAILKLWRGD